MYEQHIHEARLLLSHLYLKIGLGMYFVIFQENDTLHDFGNF